MDTGEPRWRILEAAPGAPGDATNERAPREAAAQSRSTPGVGLPVVGGVLGVLLGLVAVALVVLGPTPTFDGPGDDALTVAAAAPLPGSTGAPAEPGQASPEPTAELVVDVGGAVARPGVYRLPPGARVGDRRTGRGTAPGARHDDGGSIALGDP